MAGYDAVFLGMGLAGVNALGLNEPSLTGLRDAVDFIAELRQSQPGEVAVGRRVVVIGGGMTAVDASVQCRLLGADEVTMVYRRGAEAMSASTHEQQWAQKNGVTIRHWAAPKAVLSENGAVTGMRFASTVMKDGKLVETGEQFELQADMVLRAIGQSLITEPVAQLELKGGRIVTDLQGKTSLAKVWAGGDCRHGGRDLTVEAVEHGKQAAALHPRSLEPLRGVSHGRSQHHLSSASRAPTPSGWPARRRPTRRSMSSAPSRLAGAGWSGRRSARTRRSSTSTARATRR